MLLIYLFSFWLHKCSVEADFLSNDRGCVTPKVLSNIASSIEENGSLDFELIEGFYGLPEELQDKVKQAIEQGEIDPSDVTVVS